MKTTDINELTKLQTYINRKIDLIIKGLTQPSEYEQNTINDFYENTETMIKEMFNLSCTKLDDFLQNGKLYTKTRIMEIYGSVIRYIITFVKGEDFNQVH